MAKVRRRREQMFKFFRKIKLRWHIYWMAVDNRPLFERLNDYDENGVPYWEKWEKRDNDSN